MVKSRIKVKLVNTTNLNCSSESTAKNMSTNIGYARYVTCHFSVTKQQLQVLLQGENKSPGNLKVRHIHCE